VRDLAGTMTIVVDDEPDNLGVIKLVLDFHRVETYLASSAQACLTMLEEKKPDFLLVDVQMPVMSGIDLLKVLRADPRWTELPVIAVTARAMAGERERILAEGFDGYIPKPINAMTLIDDIIKILRKKERK
jgi:CheY-like chemotaxis protein